MAQGEFSAAVDAVVADPVVPVVERGAGRDCLRSGEVGLLRGAAAQGVVWPDRVVVDAEVVELGLQFGRGGGRGLLGEPFLEVWWKRSTFPQVCGW